jgi:hypothetical protein
MFAETGTFSGDISAYSNKMDIHIIKILHTLCLGFVFRATLTMEFVNTKRRGKRILQVCIFRKLHGSQVN